MQTQDHSLQQPLPTPLTDDDIYDVTECVDSYDVTRKLYAIRAMNKKIQAYQQQAKEAMAFFERKVEGLEKQIEFLTGNVDRWMVMNDKTSLSTPAGTVGYINREKWVWNLEDEKLEEWVKTNHPDLVKVVSTEKVNLSDVKKKLKESGNIPPEVASIIPEHKINIRTMDKF